MSTIQVQKEKEKEKPKTEIKLNNQVIEAELTDLKCNGDFDSIPQYYTTTFKSSDLRYRLVFRLENLPQDINVKDKTLYNLSDLKEKLIEDFSKLSPADISTHKRYFDEINKNCCLFGALYRFINGDDGFHESMMKFSMDRYYGFSQDDRTKLFDLDRSLTYIHNAYCEGVIDFESMKSMAIDQLKTI